MMGKELSGNRAFSSISGLRIAMPEAASLPCGRIRNSGRIEEDPLLFVTLQRSPETLFNPGSRLPSKRFDLR
jgi:hypothetical protein